MKRSGLRRGLTALSVAALAACGGGGTGPQPPPAPPPPPPPPAPTLTIQAPTAAPNPVEAGELFRITVGATAQACAPTLAATYDGLTLTQAGTALSVEFTAALGVQGFTVTGTCGAATVEPRTGAITVIPLIEPVTWRFQTRNLFDSATTLTTTLTATNSAGQVVAATREGGELVLRVKPGRYDIRVADPDALPLVGIYLPSATWARGDAIRVLYPDVPKDTVTFTGDGSATIWVAQDGPTFNRVHYRVAHDTPAHGIRGILSDAVHIFIKTAPVNALDAWITMPAFQMSQAVETAWEATALRIMQDPLVRRVYPRITYASGTTAPEPSDSLTIFSEREQLTNPWVRTHQTTWWTQLPTLRSPLLPNEVVSLYAQNAEGFTGVMSWSTAEPGNPQETHGVPCLVPSLANWELCPPELKPNAPSPYDYSGMHVWHMLGRPAAKRARDWAIRNNIVSPLYTAIPYPSTYKRLTFPIQP